MRNFGNRNIWKDSITIVKKVYHMTELLPLEEKYGMRSQISRAAISIPSNIAEGFSRNSQIDFKRFLEIVLGSNYELETQLIIIDEPLLISKKAEIAELVNDINKIQKMINKLITKLKAN